MKQQNIYDNKEFFDGYQSLRDNLSANELIEIPQMFKLIGGVKDSFQKQKLHINHSF